MHSNDRHSWWMKIARLERLAKREWNIYLNNTAKRLAARPNVCSCWPLRAFKRPASAMFGSRRLRVSSCVYYDIWNEIANEKERNIWMSICVEHLARIASCLGFLCDNFALYVSAGCVCVQPQQRSVSFGESNGNEKKKFKQSIWRRCAITN